MDVIEVNGAHIAYTHRPGLGRTIVFANSLGSDQSIWDDVIAALPKGYGIVTYDLRGHGLSSGICDSIEGLADDASQLIDHLGLTDVLFCGVSIGGMIAQLVAAKRADVLRGAVLCNTAMQIGTPTRWAERIEAVQQSGLEGIKDAVLNNWFGARYAAQAGRMALHQNMFVRTSDAGYIAACAAIRDADLSQTASQIDIPVLCVAGREDASVPVEPVSTMASHIANAQLHILDSIGHLPCLEAPEELARLIETFDPTEENHTIAGLAIRRAVLGDAHVDRAQEQVSPLDQAFQSLITQGAWGSVWANPGISARERSMLTLALLAATGNFDEIPMHIRASARTGASERDITEAFQHVAIYAGVPRANHALKLAKQTLATMKDGSDD